MSVETAPAVHGHGHHEDLAHQFEQMDQQNESYIVGMWTFLVTEIMFFGALFLCYTLYRSQAPGVFFEISRHHLNVWLHCGMPIDRASGQIQRRHIGYHVRYVPTIPPR